MDHFGAVHSELSHVTITILAWLGVFSSLEQHLERVGRDHRMGPHATFFELLLSATASQPAILTDLLRLFSSPGRDRPLLLVRTPVASGYCIPSSFFNVCHMGWSLALSLGRL